MGKRTVPAFTGAEADAAACFSHGRCFSLLPPHLPSLPLEGFAPLNDAPPSLPLEGFAVLNDTPVACQIREPTDPQGDRCPPYPGGVSRHLPIAVLRAAMGAI